MVIPDSVFVLAGIMQCDTKFLGACEICGGNDAYRWEGPSILTSRDAAAARYCLENKTSDPYFMYVKEFLAELQQLGLVPTKG